MYETKRKGRAWLELYLWPTLLLVWNCLPISSRFVALGLFYQLTMVAYYWEKIPIDSHWLYTLLASWQVLYRSECGLECIHINVMFAVSFQCNRVLFMFSIPSTSRRIWRKEDACRQSLTSSTEPGMSALSMATKVNKHALVGGLLEVLCARRSCCEVMCPVFNLIISS